MERYLPMPEKNGEFVRNRYKSLPWKVSRVGHHTNVFVAGTWSEVRAEAHRSSTLGSLHNLFAPRDWMSSVYNVGGYRAYLSGKKGRTEFVLSARCIGLTLAPEPYPVYDLTAVTQSRGVLVTSKSYTGTHGGHTLTENGYEAPFWHSVAWDAAGMKEMPPQIVADYLQDHDHTVWTDEKVAHLRMTDWFDNK